MIGMIGIFGLSFDGGELDGDAVGLGNGNSTEGLGDELGLDEGEGVSGEGLGIGLDEGEGISGEGLGDGCSHLLHPFSNPLFVRLSLWICSIYSLPPQIHRSLTTLLQNINN